MKVPIKFKGGLPYTHIYIYPCACVYIYIDIDIDRDRDRDRDREMLPTSEPTNMKPAMRCAILKLQVPLFSGTPT